MRVRMMGLVLVTMLTAAGGVAAAGPAQAGSAKAFKNCTALNAKYRHGVALPKAKDKVAGRTKPVANFKVDRALYNANKKMDRDKDRVACEKR